MLHLREALDRFLSSNSSKVLSIRGRWGVGKTTFWTRYIAEKRNLEPPLGLSKYAYVSLYGISSVTEINNAIITKTKAWSLDQEKREPKASSAGWAGRFLQLVRHAEIPYFAGTQLIADYAIDKLIGDQLICFDDLERRAGLPADVFTGLISQLTEQKRCKVVLIYNDSDVDDDSLTKAIAAARDKLIDREINYAPAVSDNLAIVGSSALIQYARGYLEALGIANIRVMKRTEEALMHFEKNYGKQYPQFAPALLERVALLSIIHYAFAHDFSLAKFSENDMAKSFIPDKEEKLDELTKRIRGISSKTNYLNRDWEEPIHLYLRDGYIDSAATNRIFSKAEESFAKDNLNAQHSEIWQMYHHSFVPTQDEFVAAQLGFLEQHYERLSLYDVDAAVGVVRELGADPSRLKLLLNRKIDHFAATTSLKDFDDYRFRFDRLSQEVSEQVKVKIKARQEMPSLSQLLQDLTARSSFDPSKLLLLCTYSKEDFLNWLCHERDLDTIGISREFIERFEKFTEKGAAESVAILKSALAEIRTRSKIDEMRVDKMILKAK